MGIEPNKLVAYDQQDNSLQVKSTQKFFREGFPGAALDASKWDSAAASGGSIVVGGSSLTLNSGVGLDAETSITSKQIFSLPLRLTFGLQLSQRIANQTFYVELISVDPVTLQPDGKHAAALLFDGTTATQGKYRVQADGLAPLDSAVVNFPTTASGSMYEIELFPDESWFHGGGLDTTSSRANTYRRHQQIPDPNALYKIRIRWRNNNASAPASSSAAILQFVYAQEFAEVVAEISAGRGQSSTGQSMGVYVTGSATVSVTGQASHDAVISGNPLRIGARALTTNYAAVASGDQADLVSTLVGALVVKPYSIPESDWQFACAAPITTAVDTALKAAAGAGIRNYLTGIQFINASATATEVTIKDGATVIWRGYLPANSNLLDIQFPTPLKGTANTVLNFGVTTAGASVYVSAQGYSAP